ncbi:MAG: hypothetical protein IH597_02810 [Bacteroidales bacterium]|nr:hypothetical protein [Bacteroidales bacterium]
MINWLLEGDVAIQYQVYRDLLGTERPDLQKRIAQEGWGAQLLKARKPDGYWSERYYQPKWISAHYTLLDLKNLNIAPDNLLIQQTLQRAFKEEKSEDGGINPANSIAQSDVCVNGMALNFAAYFKIDEENLKSVIDFLLSQRMADGGFNCRSNRSGAKHSSMHTTLSVLEGLFEYERNGYIYRLDEVRQAKAEAQEFLLMHRLFKSDKTGSVIQERFLKFPYPCRWYYDILRVMDYFQFSGLKYDPRMDEVVEIILSKRTVEGKWKLSAAYSGQVHFTMEQAGKPSRWNTLRVLRVLRYAGKNDFV